MENIFDFQTQDAENVLAAIKKDDVKAFGALTEGGRYFSLCFGKFPILSLCYLHGATKILWKFERRLLKVDEFAPTFDDIDSYTLFKRRAGRALRLYLDDGIVTPAQMLAVLGANYRLKFFVSRGYVSVKEYESIQKVYSLAHAQSVKFSNNRMSIKPLPLSRAKKVFIAFSAIGLTVAVTLSSLFVSYSLKLPTGQADKPFSISTEKAYNSAIASDAYSRLECDLTPSGGVEVFSGNLDGNGHTVYLSSLQSAYIKTLTGTIKNLNVVISNCSINADGDTALLIGRNEGTLQNVNVTFDNCTFTVTPSSETSVSRYLSILTATNVGTIENCTLNGKATINGTAGVNTFFAAAVARNGGTVKGCTTTVGSKLTANTADIAGLVGENTAAGVVDGCVNNAEISQSSAAETWSPNVGGIVVTNYGKISNSTNNGALISASTSAVRTMVYVGGIACINEKTIEFCKNTASVKGSGVASYVYAGGVAALSTSLTAGISDSGSECALDITVSGDNFGFAGGVTGFNNQGKIFRCFSASTFSKNGNSEFMFFGGLSGCVDIISIQYTNLGQYYYFNNSFFKAAGVNNGIPVVIYDNSWGKLDGDFPNTTVYDSLDALKQSGVYR